MDESVGLLCASLPPLGWLMWQDDIERISENQQVSA